MSYKYHVHISSKDAKKPGWKHTPIVLEKGNKKVHDEMYTKTYVGTGNIDLDVFDIITKFGNLYNFSRFKIELLNNTDVVCSYNEKVYRELHFKLKIDKENFSEVKQELLDNADKYNYAVSNNPREVGENYVTQFINLRFLSGTHKDSEIIISYIIDFLKTLEHTTYLEKKDELSVFDTNFTKDSWWAH